MAQSPAHIQRPLALASALAALAVAAALCGAGFATLLTARAPVVVVAAADRLALALERAPWIGAGVEGPVVWAIAAAGCADCAPFLEKDVPALQADGFAVRLILYAPEGAPAADTARALELARARAGADAALEPGEAEGYLAWGRESAAEIAAALAENGASFETPALIWRRGAEWRVLLGRAAAARARIAADLKPAA